MGVGLPIPSFWWLRNLNRIEWDLKLGYQYINGHNCLKKLGTNHPLSPIFGGRAYYNDDKLIVLSLEPPRLLVAALARLRLRRENCARILTTPAVYVTVTASLSTPAGNSMVISLVSVTPGSEVTPRTVTTLSEVMYATSRVKQPINIRTSYASFLPHASLFACTQITNIIIIIIIIMTNSQRRHSIGTQQRLTNINVKKLDSLKRCVRTVSYTHLTLPTIYSV